jgi:thymidylate synthase ThyX
MPETRQVYLLSPRLLSPETIAVAFAKASRSPQSFREIAAELSDEKSAQFHEKWVVGYGHASVAEHAVLHIAVENVSRLAIECLESNRLASYTEKSTRYQLWDPDSFYVPKVVAGGPHAALYQDTCLQLFQAYQRALVPIRRVMQSQYPRRDGESEARWEARLRSRYVDSCRFLLPAASLANVGVTANARVLESAIRKMLSHPLEEVRSLGQEIKAVAQDEVPTLVKYAEPVPYQSETARALSLAAAPLATDAAPRGRATGETNGADVHLVAFDPLAEERFLAACLYRYGQASFAACLAAVAAMPADERAALATEALGRLAQYDVPLRELEHVTYTFDAVMDQGGYFEIKRHRMMTQSPQQLTCRLGYAMPRAIVDAGLQSDFEQAMQAASAAYEVLASEHPEEASYIVPNAFNRRVLLTLNLRQAFHLCELRGGANAHYSVRRTAGQIYEAIAAVHPALAAYMRCRTNPDWRAIEGEHFATVS